MTPFDWIEPTDIGFFCHPGTFYLDPKRSVPRAVVSHAHADHYPSRLGEVHGHPATLALAKARYRSQAGRVTVPHAYHETFALGDLEVTLLPAGHMLGSCQVMVHYPKRDETLLYSGDFALQPNATCAPLVYPDRKVDLLICESTFGKKELHATPEESLAKVLEKSRLPMLVAAYSMGKAQRMNALLRKVDPDLPVFVHRVILPFHRVYEEQGIELGNYAPYHRKTAKYTSRYAYLIPPRALSSYQNDIRYHRVFASGWNQKKKFYFLEDRLDISDHAAAHEIQAYIERIAPQEVWFWHGYPEELIPWCEARGIRAKEV